MVKRLLAVLILLAVNSALLAQNNSSTLKGVVTDQLGSLVVGAKVTLRDSKGVVNTSTSNAAGAFEFKRLSAGTYQLNIAAEGFTPFEEKSVEVTARDTTTFDVQLIVSIQDQQVTVDDRSISTDSDNNASAVVLRGRELEALPNDPQALAAALNAMAGPVDQEGGGAQIKVDGFSNGQIPPKEAIREVRINNNPFSAENEFPGFTGIEIFTQPGSDKWRGSVSFDFNDESLNSRYPFASTRAPFQQRSWNFNLSGPIVAKRLSFSAYFGRYASDSNSIVNATTLDPTTLRQVAINGSFVTPQISTYGNARVDFKVNKKHTLAGRFNYGRSSQDLQGIGNFSLPSRAYANNGRNFNLQLTETALINEKTVNETRFQFSRNRFRQISATDDFALNVLDSFFGGGSQVGSTANTQDRYELQNFTSWSVGSHFVKIGGRLRHVKIDSVSPGNFGGTYTFAGGTGPALDANDQVIAGPEIQLNSLERYRRTLVFSRAGMTPAQIRALGGGATQFSIAGGTPQAIVKQTDAAFYFQDEWRVTPQFTLSPGLRYENQTNVTSNFNFAPRLGFAWSPVFGKKAPATPPAPPANTTGTAAAGTTATATATPAAAPPKPPGPPKTVFRGGVGLFYNRISEDLTLQSLRFDGSTQQQFLVFDPTVLDLFPTIPSVTQLAAFAQPQTRRTLDEDLHPSRSFRAMFTVERLLFQGIRFSASYSHARTYDLPRLVNINAPLGGTFIEGQANSGVRPLGNAAGNVLEYQPTGRLVSNSLNLNINGQIKTLNFWGGYSLSKGRNTDGGFTGSPFDAYDFSREFARTPGGSLSFSYGGFYYQAPHGFSLNMFSIAVSGQPFNITIGRDKNGDTFFSERPAFATDLTKPGVVVTPLGAFDPNPTPGQTIIPRNFGRGPGFVSINLGVEKIIKFGRAIEPKTAPPGGAVVTTSGAATPPASTAAKKPPVQRPYTLSFSAYISNLLNRTNKGVPVGNMTSPYFLQSASGSNNFIFGPGGGQGGNRLVSLRVRVSF
jgi:hypothetical protein